MSSPALSSTEAAERLGVSHSTLKNWVVRLPVATWIDEAGVRRFSPESLAVLETVKRMREDERSYATIRRVIEPLAPPAGPSEASRATPSPERTAETMAIVRPLWNALQNENATAARRIARLEARLDDMRVARRELEAELADLRVRLAHLERPATPWWRRLFREWPSLERVGLGQPACRPPART